ncbi:MAG: ArsR/SmtB family transcription factor [Faecousia sp.]
MEIMLDQQPHLLYETIEMIYKYVNHISFLKLRDKWKRHYAEGYDKTWEQRLECLQAIMEKCCADLNPEDGDIQFFFHWCEGSSSREGPFLARVMTMSFLLFREHDLQGEGEALKAFWRNLQQSGYHFTGFGIQGLEWEVPPAGEQQKSLIEEIYALDYPAEFRMDVIYVLSDYDRQMDRLLKLLQPYAERLQACFDAEPWLMQSTAAYWQQKFQHMTPCQFMGSELVLNKHIPEADSRVCFLLMSCGEAAYNKDSAFAGDGNRLFFAIGCGVLAEARGGYIDNSPEMLSMVLRVIADKTRFEILRRLSGKRSFCQELAQELNCDAGNLSRSLTQMCSYGLMTQERERSRVYYRTNTAALRTFLHMVEQTLTEQEKA